MTIKEIYKMFRVPPNLQEHMIRVAKVARFIFDHWVGPKLDWQKLEKICLLHDLGNVVKFDLDRYPEFLGRERES